MTSGKRPGREREKVVNERKPEALQEPVVIYGRPEEDPEDPIFDFGLPPQYEE